MPDNPHAIHNLVGDALRESTDLASKEFALFRTEMAANVKSLFLGIAMLIGAAVFAVAAIIWLTQALVEWLGAVLESEALAALIVGGALAAIAIGLGLYGRSAMSSATLTPERTVRSVRRDGEVLSERVSG